MVEFAIGLVAFAVIAYFVVIGGMLLLAFFAWLFNW